LSYGRLVQAEGYLSLQGAPNRLDLCIPPGVCFSRTTKGVPLCAARQCAPCARSSPGPVAVSTSSKRSQVSLKNNSVRVT